MIRKLAVILALICMNTPVSAMPKECFNQMIQCLDAQVACERGYTGQRFSANDWSAICVNKAKRCVISSSTCDDDIKSAWINYFSCTLFRSATVCMSTYLGVDP